MPSPRPVGVVPELADHSDSDGFRAHFMQRLGNHNVLVPRHLRTPKHQQVTIFDWDDTLLPTSALQQFLAPSAQDLAKVERCVVALVEKAMTYGRTFIITNALEGWVEQSCALYYPRLAAEVLPHVQIISARTAHEANFPGDVHAWKVQAFLQVRRAMRQDIITNLLSIGDSPSEMYAVHAMAMDFPEALVKTVKLCGQPTVSQLHRQVELVLDNFDTIAVNAQNMSTSLHQNGKILGLEPCAREMH
jgi:hypothetical protein